MYLCFVLRLSLLGPGNPTTCIYVVFQGYHVTFSGNPTTQDCETFLYS